MDAAVAAAAFRGGNGRANAARLRGDLASLAAGLRRCLLWDYPQRGGAEACGRVAACLRARAFPRAAAVVVDGAPFFALDAAAFTAARAPRFAVLDGGGAPRWAAAAEAAAYGAALGAAGARLAAFDGAGPFDAGLGAAGLAAPSLWGWLLDYPAVYAFADGAAAARTVACGAATVFTLETAGGLAGPAFSAPDALVDADLEAAMERLLGALRPSLPGVRYARRPARGAVAF